MDRFYFVVHTHWDREWYQPFQRMRVRLVAMADRMIPEVESGAIPHFHFDGQTIVLEDYLEVRPRNAPRLAKLIRDGRIAVGPWYVLADSFLVSGESLIRNLEIGMEIARRFGKPLELGYLPDQFGHTAQMPQILAGFGFKAALLWRGVGADVNRNRFLWEALDGTRIPTVYLPHGYSNGANLPLGSAEEFRRKVLEIAEREREFAADTPILVMNGTDHAEPDPRLRERIAESGNSGAPAFEIGSLAGYVEQVLALPSDSLPVHRGELRSALRAHLLPGVTSARTWIKQRDFANTAVLERHAGPLAALAVAAGGGEGLADYLELAWKTELQNHPHDSICGCSIDQVHQDMRYRFDQAAMMAETVVRAAADAMLAPGQNSETVLAVFNPTFGHEAVVRGRVEIEEPEACHAMVAADGRRIPVVIEAGRADHAFEAEMPAAELKAVVAGLTTPSIMGQTVKRYVLRRRDERSYEMEVILSRTPTSPLDIEQMRAELLSALPDSAQVSIRAHSAARCAVSFLADDLVPTGFSFYRLSRLDSEPAASEPSQPLNANNTIENEFYRISPTRRGVSISDIETGEAMELYFEDDGDRGDEYNYDPVAGAAPISEPAELSARVEEDGPARKRLRLSLGYDLPKGLSEDRHSRLGKTVRLGLDLTAALYPGLKRIDFAATVDNRARDHRLRAALRTPALVNEALSDTAFGVVNRMLNPVEPRGTEEFCPTVPHRTVTAVEGATLSAAMMSRGLYEVEARREASGTTLLLTLLRCVGWLSRSDLATRAGGAGPELETPGAEEQGVRRFEFAVTTYRGGYLEAGLMARAASYAFPPRLFVTGAARASDGGLWLARCDNPRVMFSTAHPLADGGGWILRLYSVSPEPEAVRLTFGVGASPRPVDFAGRRLRREAMRRRSAGVEMTLRPYEIVTFQAGVRKNFHASRKKD